LIFIDAGVGRLTNNTNHSIPVGQATNRGRRRDIAFFNATI
jgi:hypothetical protein